MHPFDDDLPLIEETQENPYGPPESVRMPLNIGLIVNIVALVLAAIGSVIPFISFTPLAGNAPGFPGPPPGYAGNQGNPGNSGDSGNQGQAISILQYLSNPLAAPHSNGLPLVWAGAFLVIVLITLTGMFRVHSRLMYVAQVMLAVLALWWGLLTIATFTDPHSLFMENQILPSPGYFCYMLAFILTIIGGLLSVRWVEKVRQRYREQRLQITRKMA